MDAPARIRHIEEVQIWSTKKTAKIRVHIGVYARANIYEIGASLRQTSCAASICSTAARARSGIAYSTTLRAHRSTVCVFKAGVCVAVIYFGQSLNIGASAGRLVFCFCNVGVYMRRESISYHRENSIRRARERQV